MYEQLSLFDLLKPGEENPGLKKLSVGDKIGRIVLGEVETGVIYKVEGNDKHFFYWTDKGCFNPTDRTDFKQMETEAREIRKRYETIEIDRFDKFFAVEYPPRDCDGRVLYAMAGAYNGMLFWKEEITYQFLEPVKNLEKEYAKKIHDITHNWFDQSEREYKVLNNPIETKRLYFSKARGVYAEANYVLYNP